MCQKTEASKRIPSTPTCLFSAREFHQINARVYCLPITLNIMSCAFSFPERERTQQFKLAHIPHITINYVILSCKGSCRIRRATHIFVTHENVYTMQIGAARFYGVNDNTNERSTVAILLILDDGN